jgi:FAD/FMN-containing dehydrogenase
MDPTLRERLVAVAGAGHVLSDPELTAPFEADPTGRYRGSAAAVVRPADAAQVAEVLRACGEAGVAVVPQGGNTGLVGGQVPAGGEVVLSLARLDAVGPVDPITGQLTAGAGATLAAVQRAAADAGLAFGVDLAARDSATIGGMVATDAGGAQVLRHGTMRAQVAGLEAVLADGSVLTRLSGLEKDNAGYDLPQLLVGTEGTLAVLTAVRLRLVPAPRHVVAALLALPDTAAAVTLVGRLRRRLPSLQAAELLDAEGLALVCAHRRLAPPFATSHPVYVLVECGAAEDPIEALAAALEDEDVVRDVAVADDTTRRTALWTYREALNEAVSAAGVPHKLDVTVPLGELAAFEAAARAATGEHRTILWGHLGDGNLHVNVLGPEPDDDAIDDAVLRLVAHYGGSISAEHGVGQSKRRWLGLTRTPAEVAAMTSIKRALDPSGLLNPGKVLPAGLSPGSGPRR